MLSLNGIHDYILNTHTMRHRARHFFENHLVALQMAHHEKRQVHLQE